MKINIVDSAPEELDPAIREFYLRAMEILDDAEVPYLVGGAYAMAYHAGIVRHTKDFDVFVRPEDTQRTLSEFRRHGYRGELTFPHWLGKIFDGTAFVDLIFRSGNGLCRVDDDWFTHAIPGEAFGRPARICPAEEVIWSKSFVQERERFDGADIAHLLLARGDSLDWQRLLGRFRNHERILLTHLINFGYIYPTEKERVPMWVIDRLIQAMRDESTPDQPLCRGTFLSRQQYLIDVNGRGFIDARSQPHGPLTPDEIAHWTTAIETMK
jgi:hypothetical protein